MFTSSGIIVLVCVHLCTSTQLGGPFEDISGNPNIIKHGGFYYSTFDKDGSINIYKSADLKEWDLLVSDIFNKENFPAWADKFYGVQQPSLVALSNDNFRIYFSAVDDHSNARTIGVAYSNTINGPYNTTSEQLQLNSSLFPEQPAVLNKNGELYLIVAAGGEIRGRKLNEDGLSFVDGEEVSVLLSPTLNWEATWIGTPVTFMQDDYYYLFYSNEQDCFYKSSIGVARSNSVLGPYEKLGDPIHSSTAEEFSPFITSFVEGATENDDLIVYSVYDPTCTRKILMTAPVDWRNNGWPHVTKE